MKKEELIERYGEAAYEKILERQRAYYKEHREEENARSKNYREEHKEELKAYREEHSERILAHSQEQNRKGGKRYEQHLEYQRTGIPGERHKIRKKHQNQYRPYKRIIAPDSQLHHEWIPKTSEYTGMALVEADQHQHGFVDVIEILDGKITLLTEDEIKKKGKKNDEN